MRRRLPFVVTAAAVLFVPAMARGQGRPDRPRAVEPVAELQYPIRIAQRTNGDLLVSDYRRQQILTLEHQYRVIVRALDIAGHPLAVAVDGDRLYVGNESAHRVEAYDGNDNEPAFQLGGITTRFEQPTDMAVDALRKRLFVVDGQQKLVSVFDVTAQPGALVNTIPPGGPDNNVLIQPTGIAVDAVRQEVLVSDFGDPAKEIEARVQIFDYAGNLLTTLSGTTEDGPRFVRPQGLAVDRAGHIFVVASYLGQITVVDRNSGSTVRSLGEYGWEPGRLALPLDVVIDGSSPRIFVTNNRSRRIEVFPITTPRSPIKTSGEGEPLP